jgi:hypothetical protein
MDFALNSVGVEGLSGHWQKQPIKQGDFRAMSRASPPSPDNGQIAQEIERIAGLDLAGVRALWRATFKKEPPGALTRDLLVRHHTRSQCP